MLSDNTGSGQEDQIFPNLHLLPPEVLSLVFLETLSTGPYRPFSSLYPTVQVLGQVCSHWRHTVYSSPTLWTRIYVILENPQWATTGVFNLLSLYIDRAGILSLDIEIDIRRSRMHRPLMFFGTAGAKYVPYTAILSLLLVNNRTRIRALTWGRRDFVPANLIFSLKSFSTLPNLETLLIRSECNNRDGFTHQARIFDGAPLRYVRLCGPNFPRIQLSPTCLKNLTTLHLKLLSIHKCLEFLINLPNLIDYQQNLPVFPDEHEPSTPTIILHKSITLPNLQIFGWTFGMSIWDMAMMTHINLPSLKQLKWMCRKYDNCTDPDYRNLRKQFISTARHLQRVHRFADYGGKDIDIISDLEYALSHVDSVEELHLSEWVVETEQCGALIELLTLTPAPTGSANTSFLPQLKTLFLDQGWSFQTQSWRLDSPLTMLESRRNSPSGITSTVQLERFRLSKPPFEVELNREQFDRLATLVKGGLCVEIVQGISGVGHGVYEEEDSRSLRSLDLSCTNLVNM